LVLPQPCTLAIETHAEQAAASKQRQASKRKAHLHFFSMMSCFGVSTRLTIMLAACAQWFKHSA
jgi:hypothetical protein